MNMSNYGVPMVSQCDHADPICGNHSLIGWNGPPHEVINIADDALNLKRRQEDGQLSFKWRSMAESLTLKETREGHKMANVGKKLNATSESVLCLSLARPHRREEDVMDVIKE